MSRTSSGRFVFCRHHALILACLLYSPTEVWIVSGILLLGLVALLIGLLLARSARRRPRPTASSAVSACAPSARLTRAG
ncbi:hypothetical protein [Nocardia nepalensis]|uniref:hypothetical protein n=1 Tax=Nocardia nepalensis TaxID=3375448 RepID=UPI003B66C810